jgi:RimJ/RimL family protein N-acetyltransferase
MASNETAKDEETAFLGSFHKTSERSKSSIPPPWYNLYTSPAGNPYIPIPLPIPNSTSSQSPTSLLNLYLTSFRPYDVAALQAILSLPEINKRLISVPWPYTLEDAQFWVHLQTNGRKDEDGKIEEEVRALELQALRINDPDNGQFVGAVSLFPITSGSSALSRTMADLALNGLGLESDERVYELGYYLSPFYQGRSIMSQAVRAALAWAVRANGARNVLVRVAEGNVESRRVVEGLEGFVPLKGNGGNGLWMVQWPKSKGTEWRGDRCWFWRGG